MKFSWTDRERFQNCRSQHRITQPTFDHITDDYKCLRVTIEWAISCLTKQRRPYVLYRVSERVSVIGEKVLQWYSSFET